MIFSLGIIIIVALLISSIFVKLKLPSLVGMLLTGMILGPYALDLIDDSLLNIGDELRKIALVIILLRAGLALDLKDLKANGINAVCLSFIPALFEMIIISIVAMFIFNFSYVDSLLLGSVIAAASPAVIVPRMLKLTAKGYGKSHGVPQLLMASASVEDVLVIVIFTSVLGISAGNSFDFNLFLILPIEIILGILLGIFCGYGLNKVYQIFTINSSVQVIVMLALSFLLISLEDEFIKYSGLLAIMSFGATAYYLNHDYATIMSAKFKEIWVLAEIILFVMVGVLVDINVLISEFGYALIIIIVGLVFRIIGVGVSLIKSQLTKQERLFVMLAYTPKATVQAAIVGLVLNAGIASANIILSVAVIAIVITAPLGALLIDNSYQKLLKR